MAINAQSFQDLLDASGGGTSYEGIASSVLTSLFGDANGISNVTFAGSATAAFVVSDFSINGIVSGKSGVLLSSGDLPGATNSSDGDTVENYTAGDADLTAVAQVAFPGSGATQDAVAVSFDYLNTDPNIDTLQFSFMFGSEEYPEWSDSSYVDVAAVFVNGVNEALFNNATDQPLSVTDKNLSLGNFIDNTGGAYDIEWDGFSTVLTIRAKLVQGVNHIKVGIADTGDMALDSGLFISDVQLSGDGGTGGGTLTLVEVPDGDATVTSKLAPEQVALGAGSYSVTGTLANLNGDVITGFGTNDDITFAGVTFSKSNVTVSYGSLILDIDSNSDGTADTKVTLAGDFEGQGINILNEGGNTTVTLLSPAIPTAGNDVLVGTDGNDTINALAGNDIVNGGKGNDTLNGGSGSDVLYGEAGNDSLYGDAGNDTLYGGSGNDRMTGGSGNDVLYGEAGNDTLYGGSGKDTLYGGSGKDTLYGGSGSDVFVFDTAFAAGNVDRIDDFKAKADTIRLDDDVFSKVGKLGDLASDAFRIGGKAADSSDRIIFNDKTGKLYYDADGSGKGAMVLFAQLDKGLKLTFADFDIIT
jgi:Ca2+-binding RTX toxin-like protein